MCTLLVRIHTAHKNTIVTKEILSVSHNFCRGILMQIRPTKGHWNSHKRAPYNKAFNGARKTNEITRNEFRARRADYSRDNRKRTFGKSASFSRHGASFSEYRAMNFHMYSASKRQLNLKFIVWLNFKMQ